MTPVINSHTLVDGKIVPIPESVSELHAVARAMEKLPADAINPQVVEDDAIPKDRTFRNGWRQSGVAVVHDMPACRSVHRDRIRAARVQKMHEADVAFYKAIEAWIISQPNVPKALLQAIANKQALRDCTADPAIDAASTPEELKVAIPGVLA